MLRHTCAGLAWLLRLVGLFFAGRILSTSPDAWSRSVLVALILGTTSLTSGLAERVALSIEANEDGASRDDRLRRHPEGRNR